jgi:hypothetical protein
MAEPGGVRTGLIGLISSGRTTVANGRLVSLQRDTPE